MGKRISRSSEEAARERHWHFIYPVGKQLSLAARAFMDFARAEARTLVRDTLGQLRR